jgi:hypothetical protein
MIDISFYNVTYIVRMIDIRANATYIVKMNDKTNVNHPNYIYITLAHFVKTNVNHPNYICNINPFYKKTNVNRYIYS